VVDNVIREGKVVSDANSGSVGTRQMFEYLNRSTRCEWTAIQTVSDKGHDGICVIRLKKD
jgi:hypothetical protein